MALEQCGSLSARTQAAEVGEAFRRGGRPCVRWSVGRKQTNSRAAPIHNPDSQVIGTRDKRMLPDFLDSCRYAGVHTGMGVRAA